MMKLAAGEMVQGYRIDRFLGRGGFASVYLAQHESSGEKIALKVGHPTGGGRQVTVVVEGRIGVRPETLRARIGPRPVPGGWAWP